MSFSASLIFLAPLANVSSEWKKKTDGKTAPSEGKIRKR